MHSSKNVGDHWMDKELVKLVYGPYRTPRTRAGRYLFCEWRGKVKVGEFSDAPIPWPMKEKYRSLILCGDLVKALQRESATAVAYHWGVCVQTVSKWREVLGIERWTLGTARLCIYTLTQSFTRERRLAISRQRKGKAIPMSAAAKRRFRQRLRDGWTPGRRRRMAARMKEIMRRIKEGPGGRLGKPLENEWKAHEDRLLGTKPDGEVARELGRSRAGVALRRQKLGIAAPEKPLWTREEERLLGTKPDREVAKMLGRSVSSVRNQRIRKKIWAAAPVRR